MLPFNRWAFKEWAAICAALAAGRQSLILRKGGLHEGRDGFRVDHGEFWLLPTHFHQTGDQLAATERLYEPEAPPQPGTIEIGCYATVDAVCEIHDAAALPQLSGLHGWSEQTVLERFHYRQPGLFVLLVRVYRQADPWTMPDSPRIAGCRSWVDLERELATDRLQPVLGAADHQARMEIVRDRLAMGHG
ncbi:MAG TPA: DUF1802 family protein [Planctomycetaceae bacterium]|nr:DUF1802 family protein [Planctomycetaceae bacterium]